MNNLPTLSSLTESRVQNVYNFNADPLEKCHCGLLCELEYLDILLW